MSDIIDAASEVETLWTETAIRQAHIEANQIDTTYHAHCQWCGDPSGDGRKYCSYGMESCATDANRREELLKRQGL